MNILSHISSKIDGDNCDDFQWVYALGMTLFVSGIVLVLAIGIYISHDQVDYGLLEVINIYLTRSKAFLALNSLNNISEIEKFSKERKRLGTK